MVGEQLRAPDEDLAAVDGAACAEPGQRLEPFGLRQRRRFRRAAAVIAAATACSDACSTAPAQRSSSARLTPPAGRTPASDIRPVVTVPVLSRTTTSTDA